MQEADCLKRPVCCGTVQVKNSLEIRHMAGRNCCNSTTTRHTASTEYSLTFRVRTMLSYREVKASLLVLVDWLEINVSFQHKYDG